MLLACALQVALDQAAFLLDLASVDGTWDNSLEHVAQCYEEAGLQEIARFVLYRDWIHKHRHFSSLHSPLHFHCPVPALLLLLFLLYFWLVIISVFLYYLNIILFLSPMDEMILFITRICEGQGMLKSYYR